MEASEVFYRPEWTKGEYFQIQKWMVQTITAEKVDEKNGVICLVTMFPSWIMSLNFIKKFKELSKKSKSVKATYVYAPKGLVLYFQKMAIVYSAMTYCCGDIRVGSQIVLLNFYWLGILFDILIENISWTAAQTPINHIISWKSVVRTLRCNIKISLTDLGFLPNSAQTCKECTFLHNLRATTQEENTKTRQIISFYLSSTFSTLTVCKIHFCIWK